MNNQPSRLCPRCKREYKAYPALSRRDNETDICPECGTAEALEDYFGTPYKGEIYWKPQGDDEEKE